MDGTFIGTINFSGIYPVIAWVIFLGILLFLRYKQKKKMSGPFLFFLILFFAYLCRVVYWTQGPIFIGDLPIKQGYELVTVHELAEIQGTELKTGTPYKDLQKQPQA